MACSSRAQTSHTGSTVLLNRLVVGRGKVPPVATNSKHSYDPTWQAEPPSAAQRRELSHPQMDVASRHYEGHALEHRHVVEGARIHSDHIRRFASRDRSNFVGKVAQLCRVYPRCFYRFPGTHSSFAHE